MAEPLAMGWTGHLATPHLHTLLIGALRGRAQVSEAMAWLGAEVHGQVVLQGQVDRGKLVVDPHVG